jgi:hypothetical protein
VALYIHIPNQDIHNNQAAARFPLLAASVHRLDSNFADDAAWLGKLARAGFDPRERTIWVRGISGLRWLVMVNRPVTD